MRVNSWFNAKRAKSGNMGYAWAISPRTKFMMMITIVNNVGPNYTSSFSSGTTIFSHILYYSIYFPGSWPSDLVRLLQRHGKIPPTQESPVPIHRATSIISNLQNAEIP